MSELPIGWAKATIPELLGSDGVFVDGDWVESKDQDPNGDVRLIQLADVGDGRYIDKSNRFLTYERANELGCTFLKPGDVLVARMPEPLGRACLFPGDRKAAVTVVDVCVVRGRDADLDAAWLMHFINSPSFRADVSSLQSGSTRKRISRGNLSTLPLPVPPRAEQTRIVAKLEELLSDLDAGVAELKAAQCKLQQYRQSLLKAAVEGSLTAAWREANSAPKETGTDLLARILRERRARWEAQQLAKFEVQGKVPPKGWREAYGEPPGPAPADLPALPIGWTWASAEQLCTFITKGTTPPKGHDSTGAKAIPFLRVTNLTDRGVLDMTDEVFVSAATHQGFLARSKVFPGDVLMNIVGPPLGQVALVPDSQPEWNINQAIAIFRAVDGVLPGFICNYLLSPVAQQWLKARAKTTAGQTNLTLELCRQLPVPLPPLAEQEAIAGALAAQVDSLDSLAGSVSAIERHSTAQRQNLLRAAFAGQLVPQDPADEPAAELLARIRAERAAQGAAGKPRANPARRAKSLNSVERSSVGAVE